jgi:3-hydroxyisobutyrate dehydrogenase-like beta-hydroxyacid dehydrogenase
MTKTNIGFIGMGYMGLPMAQNILKKGFPLIVYNRTKQKAESLLENGAKWASSPREVARLTDIVITMISDDDVLKNITLGNEGLACETRDGFIHISMSTVSPSIIEILEKDHNQRGAVLLSAPVSGRPSRAQEGTLWIFLSGNEKAKVIATPVLETMSCKIYDLGKEAKNANVFKLVSNFMILSFIEAFSEALSVLEKSDISREKAAEIWGTSFYNSPIFHSYSLPLVEKKYPEGGFMLDLARKDMLLLRNYLEQNGLPMPFLDLIEEKQVSAQALGKGQQDCTVIDMVTRKLAGLP